MKWVLRIVRYIFGVAFFVESFKRLPSDFAGFIIGLVIGLALFGPELFAVISLIANKGKKAASPTEAKPAATNAEPEKRTASVSSVTTNYGEYDYDYDRVGLYRPEGAVDYMPMVGEPVTLELEPENPYDSEAVVAKVYGKKIGYMNRGKLKNMVVDFLNSATGEVVAEVTRADERVEIWMGLNREKARLGALTNLGGVL